MDSNTIIVHPEGFILLAAFLVAGLWIYLKERKRNKLSAKVALILHNKYNLTVEDYKKPYYLGNLDDASRVLKEDIKKELFRNGISSTFLYCELESKHVNEWKRLGYIKEEELLDNGK